MPKRPLIATLPPSTRRQIERAIVRHGFGDYAALAAEFARRYGVHLHRTALSRYGARMRLSPEAMLLKRISRQLSEIVNLLRQRGEPRAEC